MTNFTISIISDTVCPWCYVGKKKLDRAISLYQTAHPDTPDTFTTTWLPFYLNPHAPSPSVDKRQYLAAKFGSDRVSSIFSHMTSVGHDVGIDFRFGGKTGGTRDSHRLIQLGKTKGADAQNRVVEGLFVTYFEKEGDITSKEVLIQVGVKAGLMEEEVRAWLESGEGGDEVDQEVEQARRKGVSGVPHFTLQGKYEIEGARDPEAFVKIFEKVKAAEGG